MARTRTQTTRELPRMLSIAEVAEIFGRTDRTIRVLRDNLDEKERQSG